MPGTDIESARGTVPIRVQHELYDCPSAPVIRMVLTIYDQPDRPLAVETFINVQDPEQRTDYATLAEQAETYLLFYDEALVHRLTKGMSDLDGAAMRRVLERADALHKAIPDDQYSFEIAKAWVMAHTSL
jgi:hypothetical protein